MKKKKKNNIFQKVISFVDKKIITPITKMILKTSNIFEGDGKFLENWLTKRNTLLFISLFAAVLVFIVIDTKIEMFSKNNAEVLRSLPVSTIYNEEAYVVEGVPKTVDITLIGSKTDLFIAKQMSSYDVTVDLTGLKPGNHKVNIKYNQSLTSLEYMVNPSSINVTIYDKVSVTKELTVDVLNNDKLDPKLVIENTKVNSDSVIIKGSENQLDLVASVKALLDVENIVKQEIGVQTIKDVPLKAYDKNGNAVDVEIVPSKVDVEISIISPSKEIPVKVIPNGNVAFGKAIDTLNSSVGKVIVYGSKEILESLTYLPLLIDVTDLKDNKEYKVELSKPVGVRHMSVNNATVTITLSDVVEKEITDIRVIPKNLSADLSVSALDSNSASVIINLKGVKNVVDGINPDDITAYIDLEGLGVGTHEVEVSVLGKDPRVQYISKTKKVTINIAKK